MMRRRGCSLRRPLAYAYVICLYAYANSFVIIRPLRGDTNVVFLRYISETGSDRREVFGGIFLYYFRPIQRYMAHRDRTSFTEVRSSTLFFCFSVTLILPKATGQSFWATAMKLYTRIVLRGT